MSNMINWMGGWPRDGLVPASEWEESLARAADRGLDGKLASARVQHAESLKNHIAQMLLKDKIRRQKWRMGIARGADAVLHRFVQHSLEEGDVVLVDRLTSRTALNIFLKAGLQIAAVTRDEQGMDPDDLRKAIARLRPRLVYTAPACSDPDGRSWTASRLEIVKQICRESGVLLLCDDRQEMLVYEDRPAWPLEPGLLSIGQLPPGLIGGLKFGWIVGVPADFNAWYPAADIASSAVDGKQFQPLECRALADLLKRQQLTSQIDMLRVQYFARMQLITTLLAEQQVPNLSWRRPDGGLHLWLTLPPGLDGEALLRGAWLNGLMFQPGAPFHAIDPQPNTIRITFADTDKRRMKLGVQRLAQSIEQFLGRYAGD